MTTAQTRPTSHSIELLLLLPTKLMTDSTGETTATSPVLRTKVDAVHAGPSLLQQSLKAPMLKDQDNSTPSQNNKSLTAPREEEAAMDAAVDGLLLPCNTLLNQASSQTGPMVTKELTTTAADTTVDKLLDTSTEAPTSRLAAKVN